MLREYLTGEATEHEVLTDMAAMAVEKVNEDDVLVSTRKDHPDRCLMCEYPDPRPTKVATKGHTDIVLLCDNCKPMEPLDYIDILAYIRKVSDQLDTVFVWRVNGEVKILDNELNPGTIDG